MASRAIWKGQLRLSLVSIPVEIHSATKSGARLSFRQIHGPSGKRVHYEKTVPGIGPIDADEILKGYELGDDEYLLLEPEEIDAIKLETKKTLELVQFVDASEIPPLYYDRPYYVVPTDDLAQDAYRVVRDALRQSKKVGLGQLVMRGKEYLCALRPCGDGILLETLHYADEIREADPLFSDIEDEPADKELLEVATQLIDRKTDSFDASAFTDHYDAALRDLIDRKRKSKKTPRAKAGEDDSSRGGDNVVDLMSALQDSLKADGSDKSGGKSTGRKSSSKTSGAKSSGSKSSKSSGAKSSTKKSA
ncbi:Ku protein [Thioclava sp. JM3]|uniref:Non-homologous end joining protein Ku n=1 Tax=Thioclava nitratireducens TaxID=1915078 RepID=A0ABN4X8F3_9RHOB|nr:MULTISPECIES: Ku protein [Thioclava]AQS47400.1 Ku protein [Thioclava nitratireducens]OWY13755.1 Ku protein [Thioclava sp. F34-6]OWY17820.1 Ku protein [Thioclava sp. JM3]PWE51033.1 Ku protein [Thioclava sp. NG1]